MKIINSISIRNIKLVFCNVFVYSVVVYFVYHAFTGARGALSWVRLNNQYEKLEKELTSVMEENISLTNKISLLQNKRIDLDLLEEEARQILNFAKKNEIIVCCKTTAN